MERNPPRDRRPSQLCVAGSRAAVYMTSVVQNHRKCENPVSTMVKARRPLPHDNSYRAGPGVFVPSAAENILIKGNTIDPVTEQHESSHTCGSSPKDRTLRTSQTNERCQGFGEDRVVTANDLRETHKTMGGCGGHDGSCGSDRHGLFT
jgi:hypothetical protein